MSVKRKIEKITWGQAVGIIAIIAVLLLPLLVKNPYYLDTMITILLWAGLASAWNIAGGYAGQLSLGHSAFFGIGAYTSTVLFLQMSITPFLGLLLGSILAMLVAVGIGAICFRLRGPYFVLATLAFAEVAHIAAVNWRSVTRGTEGLQIPFDAGWANFAFASPKSYVYGALMYLLIVYIFIKYVESSPLGYHLIALREDEDAARSLGVSTFRAKLIAMGSSALFTAIGGTFYAQYIQYIDPESTLSWAISIQPALLTIVGGSGTTLGPILGAIIMVPLIQIIRVQLGGTYGGAHLAVYGAILIVVVLFLPHGLIASLNRRLPIFWGEGILKGRVNID